MTNRYNTEQRLVTPSQVDAYAITPAQAQQLDRMTQPIHIPDAPASQVSVTKIDVSSIFEPIPIKEQFSPGERANGFIKMAGVFVGAALIFSLACMYFLALPTQDTGLLFAFLMMASLIILFWTEKKFSQIGLAFKHQADAKDALHTIVASNEAVTLAKLENEDRAHEREIGLRREVVQGYLNKLGGDK